MSDTQGAEVHQPELQPDAPRIIDLEHVEYASFHKRVQAMLLDSIILMFILLLPYPLLTEFAPGIAKYIYGDPEAVPMLHLVPGQPITNEMLLEALKDAMITPQSITSSLILLLLALVFWEKKAATPGKMILRQLIVDADTGAPINSRQSFIRMFGYFVSTIPLGLGFLWVAMNKRRRAWHDYMAGTVVVIDPDRLSLWQLIKRQYRRWRGLPDYDIEEPQDK